MWQSLRARLKFRYFSHHTYGSNRRLLFYAHSHQLPRHMSSQLWTRSCTNTHSHRNIFGLCVISCATMSLVRLVRALHVVTLVCISYQYWWLCEFHFWAVFCQELVLWQNGEISCESWWITSNLFDQGLRLQHGRSMKSGSAVYPWFLVLYNLLAWDINIGRMYTFSILFVYIISKEDKSRGMGWISKSKVHACYSTDLRVSKSK